MPHADPTDRVADAARDAEIGHLDRVVFAQHDVGRLQIAVDDLRGVVGVGEGVANLLHPRRDILHVETAVGPVGLGGREGFAVDELHRNAGALFVLIEIVDADDVVMVELQAALGLPLHVADRLPVMHDDIGQNLDGDLLLELRVLRQPDDAHAAAPQHARQDEAVEDGLARFEAARRRGLEQLVVGDGNESGAVVFVHGADSKSGGDLCRR